MVISVALLGFGAAGTFLSLAKNFLVDNSERILPALMILSGLAMAVSVSIAQAEVIRFDSYLLFADYSHLWKLIITYSLFFIPFFLGALAIGIIFTKYIDRIGTLYFANMMGSGIGATEEAVETLVARGEKVGLIKARLFRPFSPGHLLAALPDSTRAIAVLDRTKEPGGDGEPLYKDVITALAQDSLSGLGTEADPLRKISLYIVERDR